MKSIEEIYKEYNVDRKRLKRDYLSNPIKVISQPLKGGIMKEKPEKEDAYYLYIELNMMIKDLSIVFNRCKDNTLQFLKSIGIRKDPKKVKENTKKNLLKNEGILNVFQRNDVKEKSKETCLKKYGVEHYSITNEYKNKVKTTCLERYGVDNATKTDDVQNKMKRTSLERYGSANHTQRNYTEFQKEVLYDEDKLLEYIKSNNILNIKDLSNKLHIRYRTLWCIINKNDWYNLFDYTGSILENEIREYVNRYYVTKNNRKNILKSGKEIDIFIPKLNLGIEFNGNFWHNEYGKTKLYHQEKSLDAERQGIFLYHIFEYEWLQKRELILNQLNNLLNINQIKIGARKCKIQEISNSEKKTFLDQYHLQGDDKSTINLGLYYDDSLVSVMTFKIGENILYDWELSRFCSLPNIIIVGGVSKLFKYFVKKYKPKSIISYSNMSKSKGNIYNILGFELFGITEPNYVWFDGKTHSVIDKIKETDDKRYSRIYDCGNKIWAWKNTK